MISFKLVVLLSAVNAVVAVVPLWGQCGGSNWTGETQCASGSACVFQNEWYSQCLPGTASSTPVSTSNSPTTTPPTPTSTPTGITTTLPASSGYTAFPTASVISGSFDGGMVKFDRAGSSGDCQEQTETGERDAVFILQPGASISNVIIGSRQAEGIHCRGPCTVTNVWWEDVCEDAITIKQTGANDVSIINGGGAFNAADKIVQHNGAGTVRISNFYAHTAGKLYRSCGTCASSGHSRRVEVNNVCLKRVNEGVGINSNFNDVAVLTNIRTDGRPSNANVCCTYRATDGSSEPSKLGCGQSYSACQYSQSAIGSC